MRARKISRWFSSELLDRCLPLHLSPAAPSSTEVDESEALVPISEGSKGGDLSALAWVQVALWRPLELAHKALRSHLRQQAELTELDTVDPALLRHAARYRRHRPPRRLGVGWD